MPVVEEIVGRIEDTVIGPDGRETVRDEAVVDFVPGNDQPGPGAAQGEDPFGGTNVHFGVREHAMGAITNGIALDGTFRPYCGTFLVFSDYMRPSIRLAALMGVPSVFVFTHDSIFLGEDGPTHQPVEQLASLRAIPDLVVIRPADANEVVEAWRVIMELHHEPAALILSRQAIPTLDRTRYAPASGLARGAYILADALLEKLGGDAIADTDRAWQALCEHILLLPGSRIANFVTAGVTEAWIDFTYREHRFSVHHRDGDYCFHVHDPQCPDLSLYHVAAHCERLLVDL